MAPTFSPPFEVAVAVVQRGAVLARDAAVGDRVAIQLVFEIEFAVYAAVQFFLDEVFHQVRERVVVYAVPLVGDEYPFLRLGRDAVHEGLVQFAHRRGGNDFEVLILWGGYRAVHGNIVF
ncbi:MAG: hypothetical protein KGL10_00715 [Alphaproteobacteria bacterium]|nr:hypothetical protein [Alphaproteobacteria bacterium]